QPCELKTDAEKDPPGSMTRTVSTGLALKERRMRCRNANLFPSGDHAGHPTSSYRSKRGITASGFVPVSVRTKRAVCPLRLLPRNARRLPSGDQAGEW